MEARLYSEVGAFSGLLSNELEGKGYERQPIEAEIADGKLVILSDALFGPALEDWTIAGWHIYQDGKTFAWVDLKAPVTIEKGVYFRINAGDVRPLED